MAFHIIEQGNIFKVFKDEKQITTIAHGCNMQGVMGAGIAKQIKEKFHPSFLRYNRVCTYLRVDELKLLHYVADYGVLDQTCIGSDVEWNVFNLFTQEETGKNADIDLVKWSIFYMLRECYAHGITDVVIPAIGCGIGGLDFNDVSKQLELIVRYYDKDVNLYMIKEFADIDTDL
jgi:O-acetyl-ADP-ribose deacetylase (regulator of RNase III)